MLRSRGAGRVSMAAVKEGTPWTDQAGAFSDGTPGGMSIERVGSTRSLFMWQVLRNQMQWSACKGCGEFDAVRRTERCRFAAT